MQAGLGEDTLSNGHSGQETPVPGIAAGCEVRPAVRTPDREALYETFQPLVQRLVGRFGEDPDFRQDLHGEIYLRFCLLLDLYDPDRGVPLRAYLIRSLTSSVYSFARTRWRILRREATGHPAGEDAGWCEDPTRGWDFEIIKSDLLCALPDFVTLLPARQREAVVLRYFRGQDFNQIGLTLGVRQTTARSLLRHALRNLRRRLRDNGYLD